jgi:hypothetical protein
MYFLFIDNFFSSVSLAEELLAFVAVTALPPQSQTITVGIAQENSKIWRC